jgi:hypothetical protein
MKDAACVKEHKKGKVIMKLMIITNKHEGAGSEMEALITVWMKGGIFWAYVVVI